MTIDIFFLFSRRRRHTRSSLVSWARDVYKRQPSGFTDNLVFNMTDLEKLDPKKDGVRFGHSVGTKKRREIVVIALEKKFKIFNARVSVNGS